MLQRAGARMPVWALRIVGTQEAVLLGAAVVRLAGHALLARVCDALAHASTPIQHLPPCLCLSLHPVVS